MPTDTARAVIDTNAVLDWLVFGEADAQGMGYAIKHGQLAWLATARMLDELEAVLARPLTARWEAARKHALTIDVRLLAMKSEPPLPAAGARLLCRDASDQMFIDLALAHSPCWLITHDRALLALRRRAAVRGVVVVTPRQWRQRTSVPVESAHG